VAIQQNLNVFDGDARTLALCEQLNLASINRRPLGLGLLTGKFHAGSILPKDDPRILRMGWSFGEGETAAVVARLDGIRQVLTSGGRTLAQGALGWIWARSESTIPIPGFTSVEQVVENVGAMQHGPLSAAEMRQIEGIVGGSSARPDLAGRSFFNDGRQP